MGFTNKGDYTINMTNMKRYREDPEFRKKLIKAVSIYQKNNREKINVTNRKRYAKRTTQQINRRKRYLKKLRARK